MLVTIFVESTIVDVCRALITPLTYSNVCNYLPLSWLRSLLHRNQSTDLQSTLMGWDLRHERVKCFPQFDVIRYTDIKKYHKCPGIHDIMWDLRIHSLTFFSFTYLTINLQIKWFFLFFNTKMPQRFCVSTPDGHRECNLSRPNIERFSNLH